MDGAHLQEYWNIIKSWIEDEVGPGKRELCPALYMVEAALHALNDERGTDPGTKPSLGLRGEDFCHRCGTCRR